MEIFKNSDSIDNLIDDMDDDEEEFNSEDEGLN
jgi:hypothetical protein